MSNYEIITKKPITESEILEHVENISKDRELTYREDKIREHIKKTNSIDAKKSKELVEELRALEIPRLEEEHIIKIADILPKNGTELRAIVSHSGTVLVDDSVSKIIETVSKYN